jgi:hypothetical protein
VPDFIQSTGHCVLELEGHTAGLLKEFHGGVVSAPVIEDGGAPGPFVKKRIGRPVYEDLVLELGLPMSRALYDWIQGSWERRAERRSGAIVLCDENMEARSRLVFREAMLTEATLPPCDTASNDPGYLTLRLASQHLHTERAIGHVNLVVGTRSKAWIPSNFRLSVDGLDCSRISRISPLSVKQRAHPDPTGNVRESVHGSGRVDFSNLRVSLPEPNAEGWIEWHHDFVVRGNSGPERERNGTLEFLAPNLQDVLIKVQLSNLGIFRLAHESVRLDAHLRRVVVDLYCERMEIEFGRGGGVVASDPVAAAPAFHVDTRPVTWPPPRI